MLVALTGGTGFVGRHVAATLGARGHRVRVLARDPARARFLSEQPVEIVAGGLTDRAALDRLAGGAEDAGGDGDRLAAQCVWVAGAVPPFVVSAHCRDDVAKV